MEAAEDCGHLYGYGDPAHELTKLERIVEQRLKDVEEAKLQVPASDLSRQAEAFAAEFGPPLPLLDCLQAAETSAWGIGLAAEFKRASPSKGDINPTLDAAEQALGYAKAGACVLSVLTEPKWFKGSLADLRDVRVKTQEWAKATGQQRPACLRKDFLVDEYQVLEAAAHGADTALLMVSILSKSKLRALISCCRGHSIEPLVEVVTSQELKVALDAGARAIGVNNRNLHTFELDKNRTAQIAHELKEAMKVPFGPGEQTKLLALSGMSTAEDVTQCRKLSCSGMLVGEALMRAADPGAYIREMMGPATECLLPVQPGAVLVKVCGVVKPDDAKTAVATGANLIGVIFAKSKRQASMDQAHDITKTVWQFGERTSQVAAPPYAKCSGAEKNLLSRCELLRRACKTTPLVVGVFMDQAIEEVVEKAMAASVDVVQLHGSESFEFIEEFRKRLPLLWLMKVIHLPPCDDGDAMAEGALEQLKGRLLSYGAWCDALLLDTSVKGAAAGGTGAAFDWKVAERVQDVWGIPVIVAGGLTHENVGELVTSVRPFGVDVASGIESAPGVKNTEKLSAYVRNAKRARTMTPDSSTL